MNVWFANFLANSEKMVQTIVTFGYCLQFPEIPEKIRENFTEKAAISLNFHFSIFKKQRARRFAGALQKISKKSAKRSQTIANI